MQKYLAREREFMSRKYCKRIQRQRPIQKKKEREKKKKKRKEEIRISKKQQKHINDSTRLHGLKIM